MPHYNIIISKLTFCHKGQLVFFYKRVSLT